MNEKLKQFLDNIDYDALAKQIRADMKKQKKREEEFFQSDRFVYIINEIKKYLKSSEQLSDNNYTEPLFSDISNDEYILTFSALFNLTLSKLIKYELNAMFSPEYVVFEDLFFIKIHGQGTAFIVRNNLDGFSDDE